MLRFYNGKFSLGQTYWIGMFGVGVVVRAIVKILNNAYLEAQNEAQFDKLDLINEILVIITVIHSVLMVRAITLSAFDDRKPGGWGWFGIGLSILGAMYSIYNAYLVFFPKTAVPMALVQLEIRTMNKSLPKDIGDGVFLKRVSVRDKKVIYKFTVDDTIDDAGFAMMEFPMLLTEEGKKACETFEGYFKGGLEGVVWEFKYENRSVSQVLGRKECLDWLK